jgi:hypothetical protein
MYTNFDLVKTKILIGGSAPATKTLKGGVFIETVPDYKDPDATALSG